MNHRLVSCTMGFIFVATEVQKSAMSVLLLYHIGSDEHASGSIISHSMWGQYFPFLKHTKVRLQGILLGWCDWTIPFRQRPIHSQWNRDFILWRHTWRKNWVNCAVLAGKAHAAELSFPVVFSHREPCSSPRETCAVPGTFISVFREVFLHSETTEFNLECIGPYMYFISVILH